MSKAQDKEFGTFMRESKYVIPEYQRGYAWQEKQVSDLIDDVTFLRDVIEDDGVGRDHYFGTIVTCSDGKRDTVIDGQQRITTVSLLIRLLIAKVREVREKIPDTYRADGWEKPLDMKCEEIERDYLWVDYGDEREFKLKMDEAKRESFNEILTRGTNHSVSGVKPSERNLTSAVEHIDDWLNNQQRNFDDTPQGLRQFADWLAETFEILVNNFRVTNYTVQNSLEAGRMFTVVNGRGRDLNIADRMKSQLIHRATLMNDQSLVEQIYQTFDEVMELVMGTTGDSELINGFMTDHWRIFTGEKDKDLNGEHSISEIHRLAESSSRHISDERSESDIKKWIKEYLDSLKRIASVQRYVRNPFSNHASLEWVDQPHDEEIKKLVYLSNNFLMSTQRPLLLASIDRFAERPEYLKEILRRLEVFGLIHFQLLKIRSTAFGSKSHRLAFQILWAGRQSECNHVFNGDMASKNYPFKSAEDAFRTSTTVLDSKIPDFGDEEDIKDKLSEKDVVSGYFTSNWAGFRKKSAIRYILYEYENSLREEENEIPFEEFTDGNSVTIEHIWPNDDDLLPGHIRDDHEQFVDRFGNLVGLEGELNSAAQNDRFRDKVDSVYSKSEYLSVEEVSNLGDGNNWGKEQIEARRERLTEFVIERWWSIVTNEDGEEVSDESPSSTQTFGEIDG